MTVTLFSSNKYGPICRILQATPYHHPRRMQKALIKFLRVVLDLKSEVLLIQRTTQLNMCFISEQHMSFRGGEHVVKLQNIMLCEYWCLFRLVVTLMLFCMEACAHPCEEFFENLYQKSIKPGRVELSNGVKSVGLKL